MRTNVLRGILLAALAVFACSDRQDAPPPVPTPTPVSTPTTVAITGYVLDRTTGEAIPSANVILVRPDGFNVSEVTDAAGYFGFANVMPGEIILRAGKMSYDLTERRLNVTTDTSVDLLIAPRRHVVSGRVTDVASGAALPDAVITVLDGLNASRSTTTGADGRYRLDQLWVGGFTMRVRRTGYDSVFRGVHFSGDLEVDIQMRVVQQSLAGTWTGELSLTDRVPVAIPEATLTHSGAIIAGTFPSAVFTGTLADRSRIGTTTRVTGTLTVRRTTGNPRNPTPCDGTGAFTGTVNWSRLSITAPQVTYSCGGTGGATLSLVRQQ